MFAKKMQKSVRGTSGVRVMHACSSISFIYLFFLSQRFARNERRNKEEAQTIGEKEERRVSRRRDIASDRMRLVNGDVLRPQVVTSRSCTRAQLIR